MKSVIAVSIGLVSGLQTTADFSKSIK